MPPVSAPQEPLNQQQSLEGTVNCGWGYIQNAAKDGGALWVLRETVRRMIGYMVEVRERTLPPPI